MTAVPHSFRLIFFEARRCAPLPRGPLRGAAVVSQHKAFVYLYDWLGLKEVAVLEPKPGVEPSASQSQLQTIVAELRTEHGLVSQRRIHEVPGMCMLRIEVAHAGKKAPALERQAPAQPFTAAARTQRPHGFPGALC